MQSMWQRLCNENHVACAHWNSHRIEPTHAASAARRFSRKSKLEKQIRTPTKQKLVSAFSALASWPTWIRTLTTKRIRSTIRDTNAPLNRL